MKIPVIINNRDLLTWPKAMVERISRYDDVGDIWILDNDSSNPELLKWYDTEPCEIMSHDINYGHAAPWYSGLVNFISSPYYVVTDSDLDLSNTPDDTLIYLLDKLQSLKLDKLGLGLDFTKVPENSPYYAHMNNYERPRWLRSRFEQEIALDVAVDTTFALYSVPNYFIGGGSTTKPYIARHLPWEFTVEEREKNEEFMYYIKNASNSSSYKTFLKL